MHIAHGPGVNLKQEFPNYSPGAKSYPAHSNLKSSTFLLIIGILLIIVSAGVLFRISGWIPENLNIGGAFLKMGEYHWFCYN